MLFQKDISCIFSGSWQVHNLPLPKKQTKRQSNQTFLSISFLLSMNQNVLKVELKNIIIWLRYKALKYTQKMAWSKHPETHSTFKNKGFPRKLNTKYVWQTHSTSKTLLPMTPSRDFSNRRGSIFRPKNIR